MLLLVATFSQTFVSCDGDDEPNSTEKQIRGYWIDDYNNLALEIISAKDYYRQKGVSDNCSENDNVYQLWKTGGSSPQLYVAWTSQVGYFLFYNPDYSWRDKVHVLIAEQDNLTLEGIDTYQFYRVSKEAFDLKVNRSNESGNGNSGGSDNGSGTDNGGNDDNGNDSSKPPYENYIHYRYYQKDYFHEISLVKQEVEFAPAGTIHGWNWKYLNVYIGNSIKRVGFQFESTYYEDEYPPTAPWPAMEYNITSKSGSAITHFPIARVFVYNNDMSLKTHYPTVGVGKIQYVGNKLIFDFTSKENSSDYYVKLHFEGKLAY